MDCLFGISLRNSIKKQNLIIEKHELFHNDSHFTIVPVLANDLFDNYTVIQDGKTGEIDIITAKSKKLIPVWVAQDIANQIEEHLYQKYWNSYEMDSHERSDVWKSIHFSKRPDTVVPLKPEFAKFIDNQDHFDTQLDLISFGTSDTLKTLEISLSRLPRPEFNMEIDEDNDEDELLEIENMKIEFDTKGI